MEFSHICRKYPRICYSWYMGKQRVVREICLKLVSLKPSLKLDLDSTDYHLIGTFSVSQNHGCPACHFMLSFPVRVHLQDVSRLLTNLIYCFISPDYPDILGQAWRHEAIVSKENVRPFMQKKKIEPMWHYPGVFSTKCWEGEYSAIFGSENTNCILILEFSGFKRRCRCDFVVISQG